MSVVSLMDHTCNIFHLQKANQTTSYGVSNRQQNQTYPVSADITNQICHFKLISTARITQAEPQKVVDERNHVDVPTGTDVRLNDKIIRNDTGITYFAGEPFNIRGNRIRVPIYTQRENL